MKIGSLVLPSPVICSPLAGCSDYPFRQMLRRYGAGLFFCEMVKMDALVRAEPRTLAYLDYTEDMHPIGAQLVGSKVELAGEAAKSIEDRGFDLVDLNCGCPVDKVTKDGSGSGLLRDPNRIGDIVSNMVAAVSIPVTIKIRVGWTADEITLHEVVRIAKEAGASMVSVHGRTRAQGYSGLADRDLIGEAKHAAGDLPVAGNGDIFDVESALHMFNHTGCDAVLVSRGTMGNPWLASDIAATLRGETPDTSGRSLIDALLEHMDLIVAHRSPHQAALDIRRVSCWYCREMRDVRQLRTRLCRVNSADEARAIILEFVGEAGRLGAGAGSGVPLDSGASCTAS